MEGGLEIMTRTGQWMSVPPIDDTLVVLINDVAEVWTNGYCYSTIHRVLKPLTGDRYSVVSFIDPSLDCTVVPGEARGQTMGHSNCEVDTRLKEFASKPFKFHDYIAEFYENSVVTPKETSV